MYIIIGIDRIKNNFSYTLLEERNPVLEVTSSKEREFEMCLID